MARSRAAQFTTVRTEGGLLPADLLARVAADDRTVPGLSPEAYHLVKGERLNDRVTRSWNRLVTAWKAFAPTLAALPERDNATTLTRERWLLPLFEELGYGRVQTAKAIEVEGRSYPISHGWAYVPLHLVGARIELDRRTPGVAGAAGASPHGLVQELLNRTNRHLWAMVSNGLRLRLLRDNASLTRQAFVEFDLETMFSDEVFDDFVVLWLTCHESRVEGDDPTQCWLERWTVEAAESGTRAREQLREGVEQAISQLGTGFLEHPANTRLKDRLRSGDLDKQDYYRQLLRVVYRLLFLFVAEDRNLLHPPGTGDDERQRYARFYSLGRIRTLAGKRRGGPHPDQWRSLQVVFEALGHPDGLPTLGLAPLGSFLWSEAACPDLDTAEISNQRFLAAVRQLAFVEDRDERVLRQVDYRNLGTEELGAIYEGLLEQHPDLNVDAGAFELGTAAGNERKTTGSYYTPTGLIAGLLDSALDPVLDEVVQRPEPEAGLLNLRVLDPACGSGHFLIAAGHRIAKRLAAIRTGDSEPSPDAVRTALREVVSRCLHGIDLNPMAVELCKVSLWIEAMEPGKPLGFLDHRILRGNALLGATPDLLHRGIPDDAFKPQSGDNALVANSLRRRNRDAHAGQASLFAVGSAPDVRALSQIADDVLALDEDTLPAVVTKAQRWSELIDSDLYRDAVLTADIWCAAFVVAKKSEQPEITQETYRVSLEQPGVISGDLRDDVESLADEFGFLHWHLAFLDAYPAKGDGGFDLIVGNPPWLSYSGRQRAPIAPGALNLLKFMYPGIAAWPASHSAFVLLAIRELAPGGAIGMVVPYQLKTLASYQPILDAIRAVGLNYQILDIGENAFVGVNQRTGLLSISARPVREASTIIPNPTSSEPSQPSESANLRAAVLAKLAECEPVSKETFSDPGVHTGNVSKKIILGTRREDGGTYAEVREGKNITSFVCGPPKKWLWTHPELEEGEYCRIQSLERYSSVPIILRQTANRPIACRHQDRTYFRNSILACNGIPGVPDEVTVAVLNSKLVQLWYQNRSSDSSQRTFPQVKVGVMRQLPRFPTLKRTDGSPDSYIEEAFASIVDLVHVLEIDSVSGIERDRLAREVDIWVARLYGFEPSIAEEIAELDLDEVRG